jgi:hypothetical protein
MRSSSALNREIRASTTATFLAEKKDELAVVQGSSEPPSDEHSTLAALGGWI